MRWFNSGRLHSTASKLNCMAVLSKTDARHSVLDEAIARNDWDWILNWFQQGTRSQSQFHHALFKSRQAQSPHYLPRLLRLYKDAGHTPNVVTYTVMLLWRMRWSNWEGMVEEMSTVPTFDDRLRKTYLAALLQKGDHRLAWTLVQQRKLDSGLDEANAGMLIKQLAAEQDWESVEQLLQHTPVTGHLLHNLLLQVSDDRASHYLHRFPSVQFTVGCTVRLISHHGSPVTHLILDRCMDVGVKDVWRAALSKLSKAELFAREGHTLASLATLIEQSFGYSLSPPLAYRRLILENPLYAVTLWQRSLPFTPKLDTVILGHLLRLLQGRNDALEQVIKQARTTYGSLPPSLEQLYLAILGKPSLVGEDPLRHAVKELLGRRDWAHARELLAKEGADWPVQLLRLEVEAAAGRQQAFIDLLPDNYKRICSDLQDGGHGRLPGEIAILWLQFARPMEEMLGRLEICDISHSAMRQIIQRLEGPSLQHWIERFSHPFTLHLAEAWMQRAVELGDLESFQTILSRLEQEGMILPATVHAGMLELARANGHALESLMGLWDRLADSQVPVPIRSWEIIMQRAMEESDWERVIQLLESMLKHPEAAQFNAILAESLFDRLLDHRPLAECQQVAKQLEQAGVRMGSRWRTILLEDALKREDRLEEARLHWGHLISQQRHVPRLDLTLCLFDRLIMAGRFTAAHRVYRYLRLNQRFVVNQTFGPSLAAEHLSTFLALLQHRIPQPSPLLFSQATLAPKEPVAGILPELLVYAHRHDLVFNPAWCQQALMNLCEQGDFGPARQLHLLMVTKGIHYDAMNLVERIAKSWARK